MLVPSLISKAIQWRYGNSEWFFFFFWQCIRRVTTNTLQGKVFFEIHDYKTTGLIVRAILSWRALRRLGILSTSYAMFVINLGQ